MSNSARATETEQAKLKSVTVYVSQSKSAKKSDNPKSDHNKLAVIEAIEGLRANYAADEKAHRERIRQRICTAYELGLKLKNSKKQWALFMTKDWTGISGGPPKKEHRADAVRFALKFMVGNGPGAQKDASLYYRAIKTFIEEGVTPEELEAHLKERPLRDLAASTSSGADRESGKTAALASKKTLKEEPKKPVVGMAKSIAAEAASERALLPGKDRYIRADCLLILRAKAESLLRMPLRQPITIKGHLKAVGSRPEIFVTSVKRRTKPNPTS